MKILRAFLTNPRLARLAPQLVRLDRFFICMRHRQSSRAGRARLAKATSFGTSEMLRAVNAVKPDARIERERRRLLACRESLGGGGAYDVDWTVATAAAISKAPRQAALLQAIAREFKPRHVLELGTNLGISAAYIAAAVDGQVVTMDASGARLKLAREVNDNLGRNNIEYVEGFFANTLEGVLDRLQFVDCAFIDGHHYYQPTMDYFAAIVPHAKPGAVFLFDDIRWSAQMWRAWSEISGQERFGLVMDFWNMGACVLRADDEPRAVIEPIACY